MHLLKRVTSSTGLLLLLLATPVLATPSPELKALLEPISIGERSQIDDAVIISPKLLSRVYQTRQFEPLWSDKRYAGTMLEVIKRADDEGLAKEDYHYQQLTALYAQLSDNNWQNAHQSAVFDMLLSDGVITYAIHLLNGKVNPSLLGKTWNYDETQLDFDVTLKKLEEHIKAQTVAEAIASLAPKIAPYQELKRHLAHFRELALEYPFSNIPFDKVLKPNDTSPSLEAIANRLTELGYLPAASQPSETPLRYNAALEQAVRAFQADYSLQTDGVIGKGTVAALNVPYARRADQIRVNLERARWLSANLKPDYLIVNLASYELMLFKDNALSWQTDIIIGSINTKTPLFKSKLKYVVVNPTWTVPRSISKEILRHIKQDPDYLEKKHFKVVDSSGTPANMDSIDWQTVSANRFPYWFVQQPGVDNSLGQVKFIFPNQYAIYLHDTPSKNLFDRTDRAFSHGCIRVKDPLVLADKLLSSNQHWSSSSLNDIVTDGKTKDIFLDTPLDILIMYWTVTSRQGKLTFYNDIYQRDSQLIKALNHPIDVSVLAQDGVVNIQP